MTNTAGCLFAGMGGFEGGLKKAGVRTLWANENNKHAVTALKANYPEVRVVEKDIREVHVDIDGLYPVDILTAGFPCQSFSIAGRKRGFDDERGKMFFEIIRLIGEFGKNKPKIILMENVPNLASGDGGKWLQTIITEMQAAGYWLDERNCRVMKIDELTGVPQGRKRLFMVAIRRELFYRDFYLLPEVLAKLLPLSNFINRRKKGRQSDYLSPDKRAYRMVAAMMEKGGADSIYHLGRSSAHEDPLKCPTLRANMGTGGNNVPFVRDQWGIRRLTIEECAKLQGFDEYVFSDKIPDREHYRLIGNAVSPLAVEQIVSWMKREIDVNMARLELPKHP